MVRGSRVALALAVTQHAVPLTFSCRMLHLSILGSRSSTQIREIARFPSLQFEVLFLFSLFISSRDPPESPIKMSLVMHTSPSLLLKASQSPPIAP